MNKLILSLGFVFFTMGPLFAQVETKIIASDGAAGDFFGYPVSISGDYIVVGAAYDDDKGLNSGSAYIFKRNGTSWQQEAKLTPVDGIEEGIFGFSVSISGDYVVVGYPGDDDKGFGTGSAYIFKRNGTNWNQVAKLTASDGAAEDIFGCSVSIDGNYIVVGALEDDDYGENSGSAYIFKREGSSWYQEAKLTAIDGDANDYFGNSVSISGNYVVIGAYEDEVNGTWSGSAYIFKRDGSNWSQMTKLLASDGAEDDYFGTSVSISGDYAVVGAPDDDDKGPESGSAYIFKREGISWNQEVKLVAQDGSESDTFGESVSINSDFVVVGAPWDDDKGGMSGSVYLFRYIGSSWRQVTKLTASDGTTNDEFGISVSICDGYIIIGAYGGENYTGSAYIYLNPSPQIISIKDVPNDQGGRVIVKWEASPLDHNMNTLSFYSIWRALPQETSSKLVSFPLNINEQFSGTAYRLASFNGKESAWEWLANQPAHCFSEYTYTAATLYDSISTTDGKHYFLVSAHTSDPNIFYDSNVDSGYSVDNLPPLPPTGLAASVIDNTVKLSWNQSLESDLRFYVIYREGSRYDSTSQAHYVDDNVQIGQSYFYKLTAVDVHENESDFSEEIASGPVPVELVSFTAAVNFLSVTLSWETVTETNNFGFSVERRAISDHEENWQEIGFVKGSGTTTVAHHYQYIDKFTNSQLSNATSYKYRLKQIDDDGLFSYSQIITINLNFPETCQLSQNFPNPFNPETVIEYQLPNASDVEISIFNLEGQKVATLVNNYQTSGYHKVVWGGTNEIGQPVAGGLYLYQLQAGNFTQVKKMLLLR